MHQPADALIHRLGDLVGLLQRGAAVDVDGQVDKDLRPRLAHAHRSEILNARDLARLGADLASQARWRGVEKDGDGPFAQLQADIDDNGGDDHGGDGIGPDQPGPLRTQAFAQPDQQQSHDHHRGTPDVCREMQGVGFQRLALVFARGPVQNAGAGDVDNDRYDHDGKGPHRGLDLHGLEEQPLDRLVDDPDARDQQQEGLNQRREVLDLAMPVEVLLVGRPVRKADGKEGDQGRHQIEAGMGGLGQDAQAASQQAHDQL